MRLTYIQWKLFIVSMVMILGTIASLAVINYSLRPNPDQEITDTIMRGIIIDTAFMGLAVFGLSYLFFTFDMWYLLAGGGPPRGTFTGLVVIGIGVPVTVQLLNHEISGKVVGMSLLTGFVLLVSYTVVYKLGKICVKEGVQEFLLKQEKWRGLTEVRLKEIAAEALPSDEED